MNAQIHFTISNQMISQCNDFIVVGKSRNYLHAGFEFLTEEWNDVEKKALFKNGRNGTIYESDIIDDVCLIPEEVLSEENKYMYISVYGGNRITTNNVKVFIVQSGYWFGG